MIIYLFLAEVKVPKGTIGTVPARPSSASIAHNRGQAQLFNAPVSYSSQTRIPQPIINI